MENLGQKKLIGKTFYVQWIEGYDGLYNEWHHFVLDGINNNLCNRINESLPGDTVKLVPTNNHNKELPSSKVSTLVNISDIDKMTIYNFPKMV
jgi:hypothetical protein